VSISSEVTCHEIVELVTDYLEGALSRDDLRAFEQHLAHCDGCTNYLDQMRATVRLTGRLTAEALEPELRSKILEAFGSLRRRES
jgi:anti-sigma factor (TIGR02949 family)